MSDVVIIGGGIAGASVGYFLAEAGSNVHLVEAESTLAYHTTGRSAAIYIENYGSDVVRNLTIAGRDFFANPPPQWVDGPLWSSRTVMRVGAEIEPIRELVDRSQSLVPSTAVVSAERAVQLFPPLRPEMVAGAVIEPGAYELDVAAIHQCYVRGLRARGGEITTSAPVTALAPIGGKWRITTPDLELEAPVVVNAAGAWADRVAALADLGPIHLRPLRRTACLATVPPGIDTTGWPFVTFGMPMVGYCKSESGGLLISPADETLSEPCDARPEEIDVARGLDVVREWTTLDVRHVHTAWAGLRSFVADRTFVAGFAPEAPGFFWLAGQGGYGIHTSAGLGRTAASLIVNGRMPDDLATAGITPSDLAPDRPSLEGDLIPGH